MEIIFFREIFGTNIRYIKTMYKLLIQKIIRIINLILFKKDLPTKISIYFHDISNKEINELEKIIIYFLNLGFKFVTMDNFQKKIFSDEKLFAITFDDGFSSWTKTLDLFKKYDVKATYYLNTIQFTDDEMTKFLQDIRCTNPDFIIKEEEVQELINSDHEIGSHTHSHKTLSKISLDDLKTEIETNLQILSKFNVEISNFAIPYGMRRLINKEQIAYLLEVFDSISFGEPGMLFNHEKQKIQRYPWRIEKTFQYNLNNISTNTSLFNKVTKRSGLG